MIGLHLSHYAIEAEPGRGGMGIVYRAKDTKLNRTVALKVLPAGALASEDDRARFRREAQASAQINHPNVCHVYQVDEAQPLTPDGKPVEGHMEPRLFIAMEYIEGAQLDEGLAERPLPVERAVAIARQMAEALKAAHERGIVHRDIKSANVMLTKDGTAKVLDFGLAKTDASTKLTQMGSTVGTIAYMSPEQARGEEVDHRTDLWSLGAVLYEMLTGRVPFPGSYQQAVAYGILNAEPEPVTGLRSGVPMALEQIVAKCLRKDASHRYQSAADLMADLDSVESVGPTALPKPGQRRGYTQVWWLASLVGALFLGWVLRPTATPDRPVRQYQMQVPGIIGLEDIDLSPDGRYMAVFGVDSLQEESLFSLFVYDFQTGTHAPIAGSFGSGQPDFAPDSRRVAFGEVSGEEILIAEAPGWTARGLGVPGQNVTWIDNDRLMADSNGDIVVIDLDDRSSEPVFQPDPARGHAALFNAKPIRGELVTFGVVLRESSQPVTVVTSQNPSGALAVGDLRTGAYELIEPGACCARWIDTGHLLYVADLPGVLPFEVGRVVVAPFSLKSRRFTGPTVEVFERGVTYSHDIGKNGTLMYSPDFWDWTKVAATYLLRPGEAPEELPFLARQGTEFSISPDGNRVAHSVVISGSGQLVTTDLQSGETVSLGARGTEPVWDRVGRTVYYRDYLDGSLRTVSADGADPPKFVLGNISSFDLGPTGAIAFTRAGWLHLFDPATGRTVVLDSTSAASRPAFSPDGSYVAYNVGTPSTRIGIAATDGTPTRQYPELEGRNARPHWSPDGRHLYFMSGSVIRPSLVRLPISLNGGFVVRGRAEIVYDRGYLHRYDIHPDGRVLIAPTGPTGFRNGQETGSVVLVIENWDRTLTDTGTQ